jgi:hypothetical protein
MLPFSRYAVAPTFFLLLAIAATGGSAAAGQGRAPGGTFGPSNTAVMSSRPSIDLLVEGYQGRGQNRTRAGEGGDQTTLEEDRFYTGLVSNLSFRKRGQRVTFSANGGDSSRYYAGLGVTSVERHGAVNLEARTGRRTLVRATGSALYTPLLAALGMPDAGEQPGSSLGATSTISGESVTSYTASTGVTRELGRISQISFNAGAQVGSLGATRGRTSTREAGAMYSRRIARGLALKLGDTVRVLQGTNARQVIVQDIAAGVDVDKSLAFSRSTRVGFSTGTAISSNDLGRRYAAIGKAQLTHQFSRTWDTTAAYDRSLRVVEFVPGPFLANTDTALLNGTLGRRTTMRLRGVYSFGDIDLLTGSAVQYSSVLSEARVTQGIDRHFQLYAEYLYGEHRFPLALDLPAGLPHRRIQHGARLGVTVWAPFARSPR